MPGTGVASDGGRHNSDRPGTGDQYVLANQIKGIAPPGFPAQEAGGEGAIAVLFDHDQFATGFRVAAEPEPKDAPPYEGWMRLSFFRRDGSLIATISADEAVQTADASMICVGTPSLSNGDVDLRYLRRVTEEIACAKHARAKRRNHRIYLAEMPS